jgi:hypothetical protein
MTHHLVRPHPSSANQPIGLLVGIRATMRTALLERTEERDTTTGISWMS